MNAALAPMKSYTGECVGGPLNGKRLTHWMTISKQFLRRHLWKNGDPVIEIGEYRFAASGHWRWFPKKQR